MTPAQMETFRAGDGRAARPRMGHVRGPVDCRRRRLQAFLDRVPFAREGARRLHGAARSRCPTELPVADPADDVDAGRLRRDPQRDRPRATATLADAHRHHLAGRDGLDQSRRLGQPPRPVRARGDGRHLQERAHPLDLQLGILAEGPAHRARHRRDEPVHPALGARPVAFALRRAAAADRHALRSVHRARPRCAELRLLPGRALHPGRDAVGITLAPEGGAHQSIAHAADRHGAGRARRLRAGLRRRARRDPALRLRLHPAGRRGRAVRAQLAARRDRRLGLSAPLDAAGRAAASAR